MACQNLVARGVSDLARLDPLGRGAVQRTEGVPLAGEPQLQRIAQLREVEAAGGDGVPQGDGVVKVHKRVDAWRLPTFEGTPEEGLNRAREFPAGDARGGHGVAPGRDTGVRLGVAVSGC